MKKLCMAVLLLTALGFSCTKSENTVGAIAPLEAYGQVRNDFAILVDVREADEVKDGMAAPAQWMPLSKVAAENPEWQGFVTRLPKDKQIVLYCAKGGRAGKVAAILAKEGFKVANMGGYEDWTKAGLPTQKPVTK